MGSKKEDRKIRVVELFAGVGGFRLGLESSSKRFDTIFANQWEPGKTKQYAFDCYVKHFGESISYVNKDINTIKLTIPEHDLLVGGFPCQDYSVAHGNSAEGIKGKKGVLWWDILDVVHLRNPKMLLLENVDRLIKSPVFQRGRDFGIMLRTLHTEGYNVEWRVINAAHYGLAQKRNRIFIYAFKESLKEKIYSNYNPMEIIETEGFFADIFPINAIDNKKKFVSVNLMDGKYSDLVDFSNRFESPFHNSGVMIDGVAYTYNVIPEVVEGQKLGDILEKGSVDEKFYIEEDKGKFEYLKRNKQVPRIDRDGELYLYSEGALSFPDAMDKPARTLLTSESSVSRTTHVVLDPNSNKLRVLTPRECERLNGFDDDWTDTGMPEKFRYFCMGNALVVPLVRKMGFKIDRIMEDLENDCE